MCFSTPPGFSYSWELGALAEGSYTAPFVNVVVASTYAATSKSPRSFSGFNQTMSGKSQSLTV